MRTKKTYIKIAYENNWLMQAESTTNLTLCLKIIILNIRLKVKNYHFK